MCKYSNFAVNDFKKSFEILMDEMKPLKVKIFKKSSRKFRSKCAVINFS